MQKRTFGYFETELNYWLMNVKKNQVKTQSYNRLETTIRTINNDPANCMRYIEIICDKYAVHKGLDQLYAQAGDHKKRPFVQETKAYVLTERVVDAAKSLAETVTVHLKLPAPPAKVR